MSRSHSISLPVMRSPKRVGRLFGDLKVRLKLMVLHNVFFLILALGVYFALYPYLPDHAKTNLFIVLGRHLHPGGAGAGDHHHAALRLPAAAS